MSVAAGVQAVPAWWMIARVSGIVGYLLITWSMVSGVVLRSRLLQRAASPVARMEWHRVTALLGLALVALHGVALVMDSYVTITPWDLVVPGGTAYRPLWVSAGVLALWLMVIVTLTAMWRAHLGARAWKVIHLLSYGVFIAATAHGLMAGTDSGEPWMLGIYLVATALVAALLVRRLIAGANAPLRRRRAAPPDAP